MRSGLLKDAPRGVITPQVIENLRRYSEEQEYPAGTILFRRGEPGTTFYVVLSGKVEISLCGPEGARLTLTRLGRGAFFGEMALVTGEAASADAVVVESARVLACPKERFTTALEECELLASQIMIGLARNVRRTSFELWQTHQHARTLTTLVDTGKPQAPLIAHSAAMRGVKTRLRDIATGLQPVLFSGEQGTGKLFLSATLHQTSARNEGPCIVVDCKGLSRNNAAVVIFGSPPEKSCGFPTAGPVPLEPVGALHASSNGTLVLRHVEALPESAQAKLAAYLAIQRGGDRDLPQARIVVTSRLAQSALLSGTAALVPALQEQLRDSVIEVPKLCERLKDIIPLAKVFLREKQCSDDLRLGSTAKRSLLSHRYPQRHATELREAIETAASLAEGGRIGAEHLFFVPQDTVVPYDLEIGRLSVVRKLVHGPFLPLVRFAIAAVFAVVVAVCLAWPRTFAGRWANAMPWVVWEPAVFMLFFFTGRLWCGVCPLSTAGRVTAKLGCLGKSLPGWLQTSTGIAPIAGFLAIIWAEKAFSLPDNPRGTAVFLLLLIGVVLIAALVFSRETWCRHLCPLGWYGAIYASGAAVAVKANPRICMSLCTDHHCFKGPAGCPTFHLPFHSSSAYNCKHCFRCLETCPHGSTGLYVRPPFHMIWRWNNLSEGMKAFALFIFFFSPLMYASLTEPWLRSNWSFAVAGIGAVYLALFARFALKHSFKGPEGGGDSPLVSQIILALAVLAWGPAMAYQFRHMPILDSFQFRVDPHLLAASFAPRAELSVRKLLEGASVAWAGFFAAICCIGIAASQRRQGDKLLATRWVLLFLLALLYFCGSVVLALRP